MKEFDRSIDVSGLTLVDSVVFVIWQWEWKEAADDLNTSDSDDEITVIPETPLDESSDDETDNEEQKLVQAAASISIGTSPVVTHTVTFKCIGSTKDEQYEKTLMQVAQICQRGEAVPCTLEPERNNPVDSQAIAFKCKVDGAWYPIGYVVKEALSEVHAAINDKAITNVAFSWVKFVIYWKKPGWYAGINITHIGEWSHKVVTSQSAKMS